MNNNQLTNIFMTNSISMICFNKEWPYLEVLNISLHKKKLMVGKGSTFISYLKSSVFYYVYHTNNALVTPQPEILYNVLILHLFI